MLVTLICFSVNCLFSYPFPCFCTMFWRKFLHVSSDNSWSFNLWLLFPQSTVYLYYLLIFVCDTFTLMKKKTVLSKLSCSHSLPSFLFLSVFSFSHLVNKFSSILRVYIESLTFSSNILFTYTDNSCIHLGMVFIYSVHKGPSTLTFSLWSTILSGFLNESVHYSWN